jgi:hypothetical protein
MATFAIDLLSGKQYLFNGNFTNSGMTTFSGVTSVNNGLSLVGAHQAKLGGTLNCSTVISKGVGNTAGIEYGGDYSASFSDRSLVDKAYVDNKTPSWNVIIDKPQWLSGTTLSAFQLGHTHSYNNLVNKLSGGTGVVITNNVINASITDVTLQLIDNTGNTQINSIPVTAIPWTNVEYSGTSLSFTGGTKIYILANGTYGIGYVLNYNSQSGGTKNIGAVIRKNGITEITPSTSTSFAINLANNGGTNTMPIYKMNLVNGDYVELIAFRIGNSGIVLTLAESSWITVTKYNP